MTSINPLAGTLLAISVAVLLFVGAVALGHWLGTPDGGTEAPGGGPTSYNDTVYYFEANKDFGPRLAAWIKEHPELRVVSVASLNTGTYGSTRGYWVVVEKADPKK